MKKNENELFLKLLAQPSDCTPKQKRKMLKLFERMLDGKTSDDMLTPIAYAFIAQLRTEVGSK